MSTELRDGSRTLRALENLFRPRYCFLLLFVLHGMFILLTGIRIGGDTGKYIEWADRLIALRFDYWSYLNGFSYSVPPVTYVGFVSVVALCKLVAGNAWGAMLVVINLISTSAVGAFLVSQVHVRTRSALSAAAALLFYLFAFDIILWACYLVSDAVFLSVSFFVLVLLLPPAKMSGRAATRRRFMALMLVVAAVTFRPVGIVLAGLLPLKMYLDHRRALPNRRRDLSMLCVVVLLVATAVLVHAWFVSRPETWPFAALKRSVEYDAMIYQRGEIVNARPETNHAPPEVLTDYLAINADRFLHYFAFTAKDFSFRHSAASSLYYVPLYLLVLTTFAFMFSRGRKWMSKDLRDALVLHAGMILLFVIFHALVQIDYDWRYRLPVMPSLIFIASTAPALLARGYRGKRAERPPAKRARDF